MLRSAALLLCSAVLILPIADPALAQKAAPKRQQAGAPPTEPNALYAWCRQQIFRRYGERVSGQPKMLQLEMIFSTQTTDACVRSRGRAI